MSLIDYSQTDLFGGIDPGKKGGIAVVDAFGNVVLHVQMPETEHGIWNAIRTPSKIKCKSLRFAIEQINPGFGGTGKVQMSKLYGNYMQLRGFLVAAGIEFTEVSAAVWHRALGIAPRTQRESDTVWKDRLVNEARKRFPKLRLWKQNVTAEMQRAIADALLIAEYCRQTHQKEKT